ncbi:MAG: hypothetical protein RIE08_12635 [Acidimicrobiales bacterium]
MNTDTDPRSPQPKARRAYEVPAVTDFGSAEVLTQQISNPDYVSS